MTDLIPVLTIVCFFVMAVLGAVISIILYRGSSRAVSRVKELTSFLKEGLSFAKPLSVEFGVLSARGYYARGYHVETRFSGIKTAVLSNISYNDLCSVSYLLAVDKRGVGYFISPAVRINSDDGKNVLIACLDPLKIPRLGKSVEVVNASSIASSSVNLIDGKYVLKASWSVVGAGSWRVVYDERRRTYTVATGSEERGKVRGFRVDLCVKPPIKYGSEICRTAINIEKPVQEVTEVMQGLNTRKVLITHKGLVNLLKIAREVGVEIYPHISGYAENTVRVRLVLDIPLAKDIVREEVI
ncbi:MAG: hypothetical protein QXP80_04970 [Zestosphaera sp.]